MCDEEWEACRDECGWEMDTCVDECDRPFVQCAGLRDEGEGWDCCVPNDPCQYGGDGECDCEGFFAATWSGEGDDCDGGGGNPCGVSEGPMEPWDEDDPESFDIYRACLPDQGTCCEEKWADQADPEYIPQCIESAETCICSYEFDVCGVNTCGAGGGAYWTYNETTVWEVPVMIVDDTVDPSIHQCLVPCANELAVCNECASLRRCNAVCEADPSSQEGATTVAECQEICAGWFPKCAG
jgi:hypothetical protein